MKMNKFFLIILLFITISLNAQPDFRPGYVIKASGDSIWGDIDYRGDLLMSSVCNFKADDKTEVVKFLPEDIYGFRFIDSKYFISKEIDGKMKFLEFLIKGKINVYYQRDGLGDHYYLENENSGIVELPYEEGIKYHNDKPYLYTSTKHMGILKAFLKDAPRSLSKVDYLKKPEHMNLIRIARDYHNEVCKDEVCIVYQKKEPLIKFSVEALAGFIFQQPNMYGERFNSETGITFDNKNYFQTGVLADIWVPRVSENLFFRLGILYSNMTATRIETTNYVFEGLIYTVTLSSRGSIPVYKIPVQLEYLYPRGIIRPKAAAGFTIYQPFSQSFSFMAGFDVKLLKFADLSINYDFDFRNDLLKIGPGTHSILVGLKVNI